MGWRRERGEGNRSWRVKEREVEEEEVGERGEKERKRWWDGGDGERERRGK